MKKMIERTAERTALAQACRDLANHSTGGLESIADAIKWTQEEDELKEGIKRAYFNLTNHLNQLDNCFGDRFTAWDLLANIRLAEDGKKRPALEHTFSEWCRAFKKPLDTDLSYLEWSEARK